MKAKLAQHGFKLADDGWDFKKVELEGKLKRSGGGSTDSDEVYTVKVR